MIDIDRLTIAKILDVLGFDHSDYDDTIRWALIELYLRRAEERTRLDLDTQLEMARDYALMLKKDRDYILELVEGLTRQNTWVSNHDPSDPHKLSESGCISANADALYYLADIGRFVIQSSFGRMVVGWWPENIPPEIKTKISDYEKLATVDLVKQLNKLDLTTQGQ